MTRRLLAFLKPYWKLVIAGPLLMLIEVAMDLAQPWFLERIVDVGIAHMQMPVVIHTGFLMICSAFIGGFAGAGDTIVAVRVSQGMSADLRSALFRKIQFLSFADLDRLSTGGLITRLTNDVSQVQQMVQVMMMIMIRAPLIMIGSLVLAVLTSPRLAVLLVFIIPFLPLSVIFVLRRALPLFTKVQQGFDAVNTVMQENLAGVRVVKAFVRSDYESGRFAEANDALMESTTSAMRLMALVMPAMMLALNLGIVGAVWIGGTY